MPHTPCMKKLVTRQHRQIAAIGMRDASFGRDIHSRDSRQYMKAALFPYNTTLNWSLHGRRS